MTHYTVLCVSLIPIDALTPIPLNNRSKSSSTFFLTPISLARREAKFLLEKPLALIHHAYSIPLGPNKRVSGGWCVFVNWKSTWQEVGDTTLITRNPDPRKRKPRQTALSSSLTIAFASSTGDSRGVNDKVKVKAENTSKLSAYAHATVRPPCSLTLRRSISYGYSRSARLQPTICEFPHGEDARHLTLHS